MDPHIGRRMTSFDLVVDRVPFRSVPSCISVPFVGHIYDLYPDRVFAYSYEPCIFGTREKRGV